MMLLQQTFKEQLKKVNQLFEAGKTTVNGVEKTVELDDTKPAHSKMVQLQKLYQEKELTQ